MIWESWPHLTLLPAKTIAHSLRPEGIENDTCEQNLREKKKKLSVNLLTLKNTSLKF